MSFFTYDPFQQKQLQAYEYDSEAVIQSKLRQLQESQKTWGELSVVERAKYVRELAQRVSLCKERLATQASREMGKPISQSRTEVEKCVFALKSIAELAPEVLKSRSGESRYKATCVYPEPLGVVFSIQPWNFPYWQILRMAACAWMAGNVILLKHSNVVAGCAELLEQVLKREGEKPLLLSSHMTHEQAALVMNSKLVQAVTFTGSTRGGRQVAQAAGYGLKKCVLELGGNDAYIVMADCDLEHAVKTCVQSRIINSGQSCIAGKRFFIDERIFKKFLELFTIEMRKQSSGNPFEEDVQVGPLAQPQFVESFEKQIQNAKDLGAEFIETFSRDGNFSSRGVLNFSDNLKAFEEEEVFGPVALMYRFKDVDHLIEVLNEGPFGLGAGIMTQDMQLAESVAQRVRVGTFVVNNFVQSDPRIPFGGTKDSGFGREMGAEGLCDFVSWKVVGKN